MALDCIQTPKTLLSFLVIPPSSLPFSSPPTATAATPSLHYFVFICICSFQCRCLAVILKCAIHEWFFYASVPAFVILAKARGLGVWMCTSLFFFLLLFPSLSSPLSVSFSLTLLTTSFPNNLHTKFFNPTVVREDCQILSTWLALCVHQTCDRWLSSITADKKKKKKKSNMKEVNTKLAFLLVSCFLPLVLSLFHTRCNYSQGHKYLRPPAGFHGSNLCILHFWWLITSTIRVYSAAVPTASP